MPCDKVAFAECIGERPKDACVGSIRRRAYVTRHPDSRSAGQNRGQSATVIVFPLQHTRLRQLTHTFITQVAHPDDALPAIAAKATHPEAVRLDVPIPLRRAAARLPI